MTTILLTPFSSTLTRLCVASLLHTLALYCNFLYVTLLSSLSHCTALCLSSQYVEMGSDHAVAKVNHSEDIIIEKDDDDDEDGEGAKVASGKDQAKGGRTPSLFLPFPGDNIFDFKCIKLTTLLFFGRGYHA